MAAAVPNILHQRDRGTGADRDRRPSTFGQAATEVDILRQVLQVLREIQRGRAHPEATYQRTSGGASMDVM